MKRKIVFALISTTFLFLFLVFYLSVNSAEPPGQQKIPPPPEPPPKVFEDGTPWKAVDQEAAIAFARQTVPLVVDVLEETRAQRNARLKDKLPSLKDVSRPICSLIAPLSRRKPNYTATFTAPFVLCI